MRNLTKRPQKSLGQNFLVDQNIAAKIIQTCRLDREDSVLEIGPGLGQLTQRIANQVKKVVAVELDRHLCDNLQNNLKLDNVEIICQDILTFDFKKIKGRVKVIGNIPYYISTPIISHLLKHRDKVSQIYLSLQKELGLRLIANPGGKDYGAFSCFVQYYTQPKIFFPISRTCFKPRPEVDSVFLGLKIRERPPVEVETEALLFKIIRQAFSQRRKKICNSLSPLFPKAKLISALEQSRINPNQRPEQLSLEEFARIANALT